MIYQEVKTIKLKRMEFREASIEDWNKLEVFFKKIYRKGHPLHKKVFWEWQFGDRLQGRSFICINSSNEIVGHVGANFGGGLSWIINVYLKQDYRGKGVLRKLYELARAYYPLAASAANVAGLGLYKKMRWIRYHDLLRYVKINPSIKDISTKNICRKIDINLNDIFLKSQRHYFKQPSIKGVIMNGGSIGVSQENVGGLRMSKIEDIKSLENHAWSKGYLWIDYITSWNDLLTIDLEVNNWVLDFKSVVPWRLNPIEENYFCDITFLSENPISNEFIVDRSYSDHGRIGSL